MDERMDTMKRCAIKRGTPLKRKGKERGNPMPALRAWIRQQPCAISREAPPCDAAHLPRTKQHGDINNLIPLKHRLHMEQHKIGVLSFATKYGVDLDYLARSYTQAYFDSPPEAA